MSMILHSLSVPLETYPSSSGEGGDIRELPCALTPSHDAGACAGGAGCGRGAELAAAAAAEGVLLGFGGGGGGAGKTVETAALADLAAALDALLAADTVRLAALALRITLQKTAHNLQQGR